LIRLLNRLYGYPIEETFHQCSKELDNNKIKVALHQSLMRVIFRKVKRLSQIVVGAVQ